MHRYLLSRSQYVQIDSCKSPLLPIKCGVPQGSVHFYFLYTLMTFFHALITGLPGKPSHKMGFRSSVSQSGHPGEGKHEGLVRRNDVLTNGFIGFSLA